MSLPLRRRRAAGWTVFVVLLCLYLAAVIWNWFEWAHLVYAKLGNTCVSVFDGGLCLQHTSESAPILSESSQGLETSAWRGSNLHQWRWAQLGFSVWATHRVSKLPDGHFQIDGRTYTVTLPKWFFVLVTFGAATTFGLHCRHTLACSEVERGCCPTCGYDLRATPSRCPECGRDQVELARKRARV
jgi:hypothetical protein